MKSQKEETPVKDELIEKHLKKFTENNLFSLSLRHFIESGKASGSFRSSLHELMDEYLVSKREAPEKPDFEKMANDYFDEINILEWPGKRDCYIAGMERIWRDFVASKEVEAINSELVAALKLIYNNAVSISDRGKRREIQDIAWNALETVEAKNKNDSPIDGTMQTLG